MAQTCLKIEQMKYKSLTNFLYDRNLVPVQFDCMSFVINFNFNSPIADFRWIIKRGALSILKSYLGQTIDIQY